MGDMQPHEEGAVVVEEDDGEAVVKGSISVDSRGRVLLRVSVERTLVNDHVVLPFLRRVSHSGEEKPRHSVLCLFGARRGSVARVLAGGRRCG